MSRTAIGWHLVRTHFGVVITGRTSVRERSISKEREPDPMITAARTSVTGVAPEARMLPTSWRLLRWGECSASSEPSPPR